MSSEDDIGKQEGRGERRRGSERRSSREAEIESRDGQWWRDEREMVSGEGIGVQ